MFIFSYGLKKKPYSYPKVSSRERSRDNFSGLAEDLLYTILDDSILYTLRRFRICLPQSRLFLFWPVAKPNEQTWAFLKSLSITNCNENLFFILFLQIQMFYRKIRRETNKIMF